MGSNRRSVCCYCYGLSAGRGALYWYSSGSARIGNLRIWNIYLGEKEAKRLSYSSKPEITSQETSSFKVSGEQRKVTDYIARISHEEGYFSAFKIRIDTEEKHLAEDLFVQLRA